ncbi:quinone oxidoreductase family protein [Ferviditalea candida]|uniref:Zinc-binding dehydrogenase n=1 Tax=Ferviditalea candida TaxID=3108399 RepID=A0ABU5ZLU7_9BACL|nr:zinc-binding dehydrogenase [Paenibacillaceae bacterium T2]
MKAIVVNRQGGPEVMEFRQDVELPEPGPRQVLIRVQGTSVNFADIKARYGQYHAANGKTHYIPGLDLTGIIERVGSEVKSLQPGQRVIAFPINGSYAEYAAADEALTFPIPESLSIETAAACPIVSFTSFNLLHQAARLEKGETVLIHAASGGVGTTAVQMAKLLGAGKVIGTVGSDSKAGIVREAGADAVINYRQEALGEKVLELTDGRGADVILDSVGGEVFEQSLKVLAMFGRLVNFGDAGGAGIADWGELKYSSCRSIIGYSFGTYRKNRPETLKETAANVLSYLAEGELTIYVSRAFPLAEAAQAHQWMGSRQHTGKLILLT